MMFQLAQVVALFGVASGLKLKDDPEANLPGCEGTFLDSGNDEWPCDKFEGTVGDEAEEKKCTSRYVSGGPQDVHRQCVIHKSSATVFNCLSSKACRVIPCSCTNGVALSGSCAKEGQEYCASCNANYELETKDGVPICKASIKAVEAELAKLSAKEKTAVLWGDPHSKVFDYNYKSKTDRFKNYHRSWSTQNLNVMEPGTFWMVKNKFVSIQGVYGWGWRALTRNIAISGKFIEDDVIQVFPVHSAGGVSKDKGLWYKYAGATRSQLHTFSGGKWEWTNSRKDVSIKWVHDNQGVGGNNRWRCKITLPLFVEVIVNAYSHHMDVAVTMRPMEGQIGDLGNINDDKQDEMKWNPSNVGGGSWRNKFWYQMTTAHGTRVAKEDNLFPFWYDVPPAPRGAKTTALLAAKKSSSDEVLHDTEETSSDLTQAEEEGPQRVVVDGVQLQPNAPGHDCTADEEKAAAKYCHDMFKVNNTVTECIVDVCQQGPALAGEAAVAEVEAEVSEEEETLEHFAVFAGGQIYKSCFDASEHFSRVAAMPRDENELGLIKARVNAVTHFPTLLGAKCSGTQWVYVDGTIVPQAITASTCTAGQLLCVQGDTVTACASATKIACQIPRLYTCKANVPMDEIGAACPGGMQAATPVSLREKKAAQVAMDESGCTTSQAWSGVSGKCFEEGKTSMQPCTAETKTVMCETKFG
mmetsp:Transcript_6386/g.11678  ORF Transcript_6386/g.11678 Transcript_6386/m.11678 type:complete len:696 (+) Transcript_6386:72-2159(+)